MKLLKYALSPEVTAFSTMREGGFSTGEYASFNANAFCGDDPVSVDRNRLLLASELHIPKENLIFTHQIHSTRIRAIGADFLHLSPAERSNQLGGVDALMTDQRNVCLCISTADCVPIIIYDHVKHIAACTHAGWRGSMQYIALKTIEAMKQTYHSDPSNCTAVIGPSISLLSFEVGDEVYSAFSDAGFDMSRIARRYFTTDSTEEEKWHIDLWECNRLQLIEAGVKEENIHVSGICTYLNADQYFSARKLGVKTGRITSGIIIKS